MSRGSGRLTLHARFGYEHWPAMLVRRRRWLDRASGLRRRRPGSYDMGSLGPTHLISLLLAVAIIAATCGFFASAVVRRNKRRARGFFLLGFFCGLMAGAILPGALMSAHSGPGYVVALVVSLLARSLLRHHMFDLDCRRRNGTANFGCSAPTPAPGTAADRCGTSTRA
jgi:hypothetical protein